MLARMRKRTQAEPPVRTIRRWTIRRKAAVLEALRNGGLTLEHARKRYALSVEEIRAWERDLERHGLYGLRATGCRFIGSTARDQLRQGLRRRSYSLRYGLEAVLPININP